MSVLYRRAAFEKRHTINPEVPPPHGDFPHMSVGPLLDMEDSLAFQWGSFAWLCVSIVGVFFIACVCLFAMSLVLAFPFDFFLSRFVHE